MSKKVFLTLAAALALAAGGCATTGGQNAKGTLDSEAGAQKCLGEGLFRFNKAETEKCLAELQIKVDEERLKLKQQLAEKQRLLNQINAKKLELEAQKRETSISGKSSDSKASAAVETEISRLEQEQRQLLDNIRDLEESIVKLSKT